MASATMRRLFSSPSPDGKSPHCSPSRSLIHTTTASSSQINLSWADQSTNEDGFKIERRKGTESFAEVVRAGTGGRRQVENGTFLA